MFLRSSSSPLAIGGLNHQKYTGTVSAVQGGTITIPHNLPFADIMFWQTKVTSTPGATAVIQGHATVGSFQFDVSIDAANIVVKARSGASASVVSKNIDILIWYKRT